jgi:DNA modification methylase
MGARHIVIFGDSRRMVEIADESVQLVVTSPPYFNVKDYGTNNIGDIDDYWEYLHEMKKVFEECYQVLETGRYLCVNICDIISNKQKYPIPAHYIWMLETLGFEYRDDIIWKKPKGVGANSKGGAAKRFGVFIQNPYPMYYFPNNIYEHILVFRKGKFDYKKVPKARKVAASLDVEMVKNLWSSDVWEFNPEIKNQYTKDSHPAMFPAELSAKSFDSSLFPVL